jgi:hypothetical protein
MRRKIPWFLSRASALARKNHPGKDSRQYFRALFILRESRNAVIGHRCTRSHIDDEDPKSIADARTALPPIDAHRDANASGSAHPATPPNPEIPVGT